MRDGKCSKVKSSNPFAMPITYITGFVFVTIFFIMFFSSQITQNAIGSLDINEITNDIETRFQVVCQTSGLPQVDVELCENTLSEALQEARDSVNTEIDEELNFFTSLFFNPSTMTLALIVIILFVIGFFVGWGIRMARN